MRARSGGGESVRSTHLSQRLSRGSSGASAKHVEVSECCAYVVLMCQASMNDYRMATHLVRWWKTKILSGYKQFTGECPTLSIIVRQDW